MPHADPERRRKYQREYQHTHLLEYQRNYQRQWNLDNPERRREIMAASDQKRKGTPARGKQLADVRQRRHVRQRVTVIKMYGGQCVFCGTTQFEHLTVDHINGDGGAHRAEFSPRYRNIYDFLARTDYRPDLYRLLCWNCHQAMTRYNVMPGGEELRDMTYWEKFGALRWRPRSEQ